VATAQAFRVGFIAAAIKAITMLCEAIVIAAVIAIISVVPRQSDDP